jgi:hypothetical protein
MDLRTLRSTAYDRASRHFGDYMAVQLSAADLERGLPAAWHVLDFRNAHVLGAWFRDTSGLPYRFAYIAIFDKAAPEWSQGLPIAELAGTGAADPATWIGADPRITALRHEAAVLAAGLPTWWIGVALPLQWTVPFATKQQMLDWFAREALRHEYVAIYDKADPRWLEGLPIADHRSRA